MHDELCVEYLRGLWQEVDLGDVALFAHADAIGTSTTIGNCYRGDLSMWILYPSKPDFRQILIWFVDKRWKPFYRGRC